MSDDKSRQMAFSHTILQTDILAQSHFHWFALICIHQLWSPKFTSTEQFACDRNSGKLINTEAETTNVQI